MAVDGADHGFGKYKGSVEKSKKRLEKDLNGFCLQFHDVLKVHAGRKELAVGAGHHHAANFVIGLNAV